MSEKIAFLGLGAMGFGMATNLIKRGRSVTGFDVWKPTLDRFVAAGGSAAATPREAVSGAPYVVFMVATAAQIQSALFAEGSGEDAAIHALEMNAVVILSSTGPPEHVPIVRKKLDELGRQDVHLIDAPVSGGTIRAADGTLTILAAGPEESLQKGRELLDLMAGKNLWIIPGGIGMGTCVKMVHQVLAGIHIVSSSEAMGFAAALGLDTKLAFEKIKASDGDSWMFENRVPHMLVKDEKIYSATNIIVKDIGIVTAGGRSAQSPLFLASITESVLASAISSGLGPIDDSGIVGVYLPQSPGLVLKLATEPPTTASSSEETEAKLKLVSQVLAAVHLAGAVEAMSLGKKVGLDTKQLYEIIAGAAGNSVMFKDRTPMLLSGEWEVKKTVDEVVAELTQSIEAAQALKYPLHLGGMAAQLFQLAQSRGLGKEADISISRIWGDDIFPQK